MLGFGALAELAIASIPNYAYSQAWRRERAQQGKFPLNLAPTHDMVWVEEEDDLMLLSTL